MIFSRLVVGQQLGGVIGTSFVFIALIFSTALFGLLTDDEALSAANVLGFLYHMPATIVDIFAPAFIIGSVIGISKMVPTGELTAMRALGFGRQAINRAIGVGALLCTLSYVVAMQWVVEPAELTAREYWGQGGANAGTLVRGDRWLHIENSWVRLGTVHTDSVFANVEIITIAADQSRIELFIKADDAVLGEQGQWRLSGVRQFTPDEGLSEMASRNWQGVLERAALEKISVREKHQSFTTLLTSLSAASTLGSDANRIKTELVLRFAEPVAATMLVFWMVGGLLVSSRDGGEGQRRVIAVLAGLFFWISNQLIEQFALTASLPPSATALLVIAAANIVGFLASQFMTTR